MKSSTLLLTMFEKIVDALIIFASRGAAKLISRDSAALNTHALQYNISGKLILIEINTNILLERNFLSETPARTQLLLSRRSILPCTKKMNFT